MQKIVCALMIVISLAPACRKNNGNQQWLDGKVIRVNCASFVVQVITNPTIGQDNWLDVTSNKRYNDVIAADNLCEMPADATVGKIIRFRTAPVSGHGACMYCDMYDAPPVISYALKQVSVKN